MRIMRLKLLCGVGHTAVELTTKFNQSIQNRLGVVYTKAQDQATIWHIWLTSVSVTTLRFPESVEFEARPDNQATLRAIIRSPELPSPVLRWVSDTIADSKPDARPFEMTVILDSLDQAMEFTVALSRSLNAANINAKEVSIRISNSLDSFYATVAVHQSSSDEATNFFTHWVAVCVNERLCLNTH